MSKIAVRVLIAEDEEAIRLLLVDALEEAGFDILEARDVTEALQLIDDPDGVQALVTDINMPGGDGFTVAQRLREAHPEVPVILVSGRHDHLQKDRFPQPFRTFPKPFRLDAIVAAVQDMLARRKDADLKAK